ncbi:uncharacterized protein N7473_002368 [Penicillium subrubescens]|jgi:hypothetical protein|uniref:Uncharacterized protein n=1 Tax=Penicillium subrubescens TaxID=1316194 RepID=A0A1Q5UJT9_9EURO|nr:uncharacterized protein N7473_002368 [Penicillium subrubescens]KAJ5905452.1 hypothetical protein N7473_002368 [Penicillium subrubescens]OKP12744.1 hypothetical protein PENSUB_1476 [Penicillium subrubescens]
MRTAICTFLDTTWFLTSKFFGAFFQILLPAVIAGGIVCGVLFAVALAVVHILGWMGWINLDSGPEKKQKKEKEGNAFEAAEEGFDEVLVNVSNDKKRLEIEIEFLEDLLRAKREKLTEID